MTLIQRSLLHKMANRLGYTQQESLDVCPAKCRFIREDGPNERTDILHLPSHDGGCRFYCGKRSPNGDNFLRWTYEDAVSNLTAQLLTVKESP